MIAIRDVGRRRDGFPGWTGKRSEYMSGDGAEARRRSWRNPVLKLGGLLQVNLHPLSRRPHFGIVVPRFLHDFVDHGIGVLRIVVE